MVSTETLDNALGMDVRLVALGVAGRSVESSSLHDDLAMIAERFPEAPIALLSNTEDALMASQALVMGIRGYFTTSLPIGIALAGMRLVLAGGIFYQQPLDTPLNGSAIRGSPQEEKRHVADGGGTDYLSVAAFTPREADVLVQLQCGHPNKVIAGKLNLSGNTVKMHLQHIMRKLQVQNRTEVVARLGQKPSLGHDFTAT